MLPLLSYIETNNPEPVFLQVGLNRSWLGAKRIELSSLTVDRYQIDDEINDTVAVEIFYKLSDSRSLFVGLRYSDSLKFAVKPEEFVKKVLSIDIGSMGLTECLKQLGIVLNGDNDTYINRKVDRAEVGIVDYWYATGTKVVWSPGAKSLTVDYLNNVLSNNPELLSTDKNPIALEVDFGAPGFWMGLEVSTSQNNHHLINKDEVVKIQTFLEQG